MSRLRVDRRGDAFIGRDGALMWRINADPARPKLIVTQPWRAAGFQANETAKRRPG